MHQSHSPTLPIEAHSGLWRILKYLLPAAVGILAILERSPALLILLAIAVGLVLAFAQRVERFDLQTRAQSQESPGRPLGDGGCFPSDAPEIGKPPASPPRVLDGGSLEHHRR